MVRGSCPQGTLKLTYFAGGIQSEATNSAKSMTPSPLVSQSLNTLLANFRGLMALGKARLYKFRNCRSLRPWKEGKNRLFTTSGWSLVPFIALQNRNTISHSWEAKHTVHPFLQILLSNNKSSLWYLCLIRGKDNFSYTPRDMTGMLYKENSVL